MLLPRMLTTDLFDDVFNDSSQRPKVIFSSRPSNLMKTDIKETDNSFELVMDLPSFKKEDIKVEIDNGYLTVSAKQNFENNETDENGKYIRQERRYGSCKRSFYVGDGIVNEDIKAKFENGSLLLNIPKKELAEIETKKHIEIE
jgi:Molecular chaperone (small heat shock protein)